MNLSVLGAGAWGTALAISVASRGVHSCMLWARNPDQSHAMHLQRCNSRYLDGFAFPDALRVATDFDEAIRHAQGGLLIVATPMAGLAPVLHALPAGSNACGLLWLCKGFQAETGVPGP